MNRALHEDKEKKRKKKEKRKEKERKGKERKGKERKGTVSYTHLTLPTTGSLCRSRWSPYH